MTRPFVGKTERLVWDNPPFFDGFRFRYVVEGGEMRPEVPFIQFVGDQPDGIPLYEHIGDVEPGIVMLGLSTTWRGLESEIVTLDVEVDFRDPLAPTNLRIVG